jgi:hypothetical protein
LAARLPSSSLAPFSEIGVREYGAAVQRFRVRLPVCPMQLPDSMT